MIELNIPIAFSAGLVSFFAPCVLPLIPAYVGYVTGISVDQLRRKGFGPYWKKIVISSLLFVLGFSLVFVSLGAFAGGLGVALRRYGDIVQRVGGLIIFVLGLEFSGILKLSLLARSRQFRLPKWTNGLGNIKAFLVGIIFATTWSPCVGAVLGSILALAATTEMVGKGAVLLLFYSLGISLPFLLVSLTLASAPRYLKFISNRIEIVAKISGILLALLGLMLLTDTYKYFNSYLFDIAYSLGYSIR